MDKHSTRERDDLQFLREIHDCFMTIVPEIEALEVVQVVNFKGFSETSPIPMGLSPPTITIEKASIME